MMRPAVLVVATVATVASVVSFAGPAAAAPGSTGPDWKRLGIERATSSSYLRSNWNKYDENYHPNYALDGDPKTAWVEGEEGDGLGATLTLPLSPLRSARALRLTVHNGYQKSQKLLDANAAPHVVVVSAWNERNESVATQRFTLERKMGPQQLVLPVGAGKGVSSVSLKVETVHAGRVYKDTCISDIVVDVDSDVPWRKDVEQQKTSSLLTWVKERRSEAKKLAAVTPAYPFAATHFRVASESEWSVDEIADYDGDTSRMIPRAGAATLATQLAEKQPRGLLAKNIDAATLAALDELRRMSADDGAGIAKGWTRLDVMGRAPRPDGFEQLYNLDPIALAFLEPTRVALFEASGDKAIRSKVEINMCADDSDPDAECAHTGMFERHTRSNARVRFAADGRSPKTVYFRTTRVVNEREVSTTQAQHLLDFDDQGRLTRVRTVAVVDSFYQQLSLTVTELQRDAAGKVNRVIERTANGGMALDDARGGIESHVIVLESLAPGA